MTTEEANDDTNAILNSLMDRRCSQCNKNDHTLGRLYLSEEDIVVAICFECMKNMHDNEHEEKVPDEELPDQILFQKESGEDYPMVWLRYAEENEV